MTLKVFKYEFPIEDEFVIEMPRNAEFLHVDVQVGRVGEGMIYQGMCYQPCLWALVNPDADKEKRRFRLVGTGTGHELDPAHRYSDTRYAASFTIDAGGLVFHLFEVWLNIGARITSAKIEGLSNEKMQGIMQGIEDLHVMMEENWNDLPINIRMRLQHLADAIHQLRAKEE